ncbi:ATP-binding protein [Alkalihalobacillus oceani]|uniref:sensor histidine kinase n=1 Tax=Halalkalibacter oceani TaxID=1653776 RepID=UPI00203EF345|nr:PAS domain-containing sensor histidine kinase [Halalkalibacter oceani]MCM3761439.1 ATP-binding protein [Halalkalibacter oceani]
MRKMKAFYLRVTDSIRSSIIKKYVIVFAVTFILPSLLIYQLIVSHTEQMVENDIIETNISNTDSIVKRVNKEISDIVLQLQLITGNLIDEELKIDLMFQRSKLAISQSPMIHSIYLLDHSKKIVFRAPFERELGEEIFYDYQKFDEVQISRNYAVSDSIQNIYGDQVVSVAIPVLTRQQEFKGVLVAELSKDYLSSVLNSFIVTNDYFSFIVDTRGQVISSTKANETNEDYSAEYIFNRIFKDSYGVIRDTYLGEDSVIAFQTMRDGWGLAYGVPEKVAFEPVRELSHLITISFIGIFVLSLLFIWLGLKSIVYPILRLTNYAKQYRKRIFYTSEEEFAGSERDEIGELKKTIISVGNSNYEKQKMLEEKEKYLNDLIEGIPYGIITVNKDAIITHVNQQFEKMIGFSRQHLINTPLLNTGIKNDKKDFMLVQSLFSEHASSESESYIIDANGQKHIVKIATAKLYNEDKETIGSIAVLQDISKLKLLESRLKQNDKLAIIGQITTGIAHEIKNPLAVLSGCSELLVEEVKEANGSKEMMELSKDIYQVVRRMNGIVSNFLNFAKMNKDEAKPVRVEKVMEEVLHLVRLKINEANIEVDRSYEDTPDVVGIHDHLLQAFLNLVLNAVEAMPTGGKLFISIYEEITNQKKRYVVAQIDDTGSGIPEKNMKWLFDPFFSTKDTGNGLGLTIARDIVKEHNGELKIESSNEGTSIQCCFFVSTGEVSVE